VWEKGVPPWRGGGFFEIGSHGPVGGGGFGGGGGGGGGVGWGRGGGGGGGGGGRGQKGEVGAKLN